MKIKGFYYDGIFLGVLAACCTVFTIVTAVSFDGVTAIVEAVVFTAAFSYGFFRVLTNRARYKRIMLMTAHKLDYTDSKSLSSFPFPVSVCNDNGEIIWSNEHFIDGILNKEITQLSNIRSVIGDIDTDKYTVGVKTKNKYYSIFTLNFFKDGENYKVYCFIDNTKLKGIEEKYNKSIPYVIIIEVDNIDSNDEIYRDSEKTEIKSIVEGMIDGWSEKFNSTVKRISDDRFMIVTEKSNIQAMSDDKFSIIDQIREYKYKDRDVHITLSIGAATSDNILLAEKEAKRALDLSLDRGGDQVALKQEGDYVFFGGVSKSAEKKSNVKSRIWSSQLANEINNAGNILIMGHTRSDFDAIGSSLALAYACRRLGKQAYVAINSSNTLSMPLINDIKKSEFADIIIPDNESISVSGKSTLLIICDTHKPSIIDFPELFGSIEHKCIIDHHRLDPSAKIDGCLFLHNPGASSTCEIVTEMLQYLIPNEKIPQVLSNGLLSGIMLDTKNFVVNSGSGTFEAAAFLKKSGADTLKIKKYFSNSLDNNKQKNRVVIDAEIFNNCAISFVDPSVNSPRIVASQAADELLNSSNIIASFVIYIENGKACISARSMGEVNVQLIMESLGGGGHQTMAACSFNFADINLAKEKLISEISKLTVKENKQ